MPDQFRVDINDHQSITANLYKAGGRDRAGITLTLGHGAGSGQMSSFMVNFSNELASRGIDTVTFNFLYTELGRGAPDRNDALEACYRAVIESVRKHGKLKNNKLAIGGKSMGRPNRFSGRGFRRSGRYSGARVSWIPSAPSRKSRKAPLRASA